MVYKPVLRETAAVNAAVVLLLKLWLIGLWSDISDSLLEDFISSSSSSSSPAAAGALCWLLLLQMISETVLIVCSCDNRAKQVSCHRPHQVTEWDHPKVIDRESNRMDQWIKEVIQIRKQDKSMNRDKGSYQIPYSYDKSFIAMTSSSKLKSF